MRYFRNFAFVASALFAALSPPGHAGSLLGMRAVVPVHEVILRDGTRRYAVPLTIGSTVIMAGLDTGSAGLRILPGVLKRSEYRLTTRSASIDFGAGARLSGKIGTAVVSIGGLRGKIDVQLVQHVGCDRQVPHCAAGSIPPSEYGIMGNGIPGEGFKAILGVKMIAVDVPNPFEAIGVGRWIVELPRPGETRAGRIVLNPTNEEAAGFVNLPVASQFSDQAVRLHDGVHGCLVNKSTSSEVCGAVVLDTGAPGIRVSSRNVGVRPWREGTPAELRFSDGSGKVKVREQLVIGMRADASRLMFSPKSTPLSVIWSGLTAYFAYSILYDPGRETVGFRPRVPVPGGPRALARN